MAWEIGIEVQTVVDCLREFKGVGRRFADIGELQIGDGQVRAIEDYGHHPSELEATIAAARQGWPGNESWPFFSHIVTHAPPTCLMNSAVFYRRRILLY